MRKRKNFLIQNKLKYLLFPLVLLYEALIRFRNYLYDKRILLIKKAEVKIISVGNISVGGSGKTPLTIWIADFLKREGIDTAILSRGYKRKTKGFLLVSDGKNIKNCVEETGDEPYLIAKKLEGIPVAVCEDRHKGVKNLNEMYKPDVVVLDDAFQHRKLYRDLDIVIVKERDAKNRMRMFPIGTLREPRNGLKRADIVLFNGTKPDSNWVFDGIFKLEYSQIRDSEKGLNKPPDKKMLAFCGLGNNDSFFNLLKSMKINAVAQMKFKDHHKYREKDYRNLKKKLVKSEAEAFITTEKDWIKLDNNFIMNNKVYYLVVDVKFLQGEDRLRKKILMIK